MEISNNYGDFAFPQPPSVSQPDAATSATQTIAGKQVGAAAGGAEGGCGEPNASQPVEFANQSEVGCHLSVAHETSDLSQCLYEGAAPAAEEADGQVAKKPVSLKKIEANRRNAQKSPGPTSPEGKQRSRWNSTKHGLLGKRLFVLEGAGEGEWAQLLESLRQDLEPMGALEELLVEKIAKNYWRLQVADGYEVGMAKSLGSFFMSMDKMARYQTAIGRQLGRDVADLKRLQKERKQAEVPAGDGETGEAGGEG